MKMTIMQYYFEDNTIIVFEREVKKSKNGYTTTEIGNLKMHFSKSEIGKVMFKSISYSPYLRIVMIDGDKDVLKDTLNKWFLEKSFQIENNKVIECDSMGVRILKEQEE